MTMKKTIHLKESKLRNLIYESVRKMINENVNGYVNRAYRLAEELFQNGIDVYKFTDMIEERYEMLKSEKSGLGTRETSYLDYVPDSNPFKKLALAIRNSTENEDRSSEWDDNYEVKSVPLDRPVTLKDGTIIVELMYIVCVNEDDRSKVSLWIDGIEDETWERIDDVVDEDNYDEFLKLI